MDRLIRAMKRLETQDLIVGNALITVHDATDERIFLKGKGVKKMIGKYKPKTKQIKRKKGQESRYVNLVDTGQMQLDWTLVNVKSGIWESKFKNTANERKAKKNQKRFNVAIFNGLTNNEKNNVLPKALEEAARKYTRNL